VRLASSQIILGDSAKFSAADQARLLGQSWERVEGSDQLRTRLLAYKLNGEIQNFQLGPHSPTLTLDDLDLIHRLWLDAVGTVGLDVHHRDVVRAALEELGHDLGSANRARALARIKEQTRRPAGAPVAPPLPAPVPVDPPTDPGAL
jgi:hypothetical protein